MFPGVGSRESADGTADGRRESGNDDGTRADMRSGDRAVGTVDCGSRQTADGIRDGKRQTADG